MRARPLAHDESGLAGVREGHLAQLFGQAGLSVTHATALTVQVQHATFDEWWEPFTLGVGPAGAYVASLDAEHRAALRERCRVKAVASGQDQRDRVGGDRPLLTVC